MDRVNLAEKLATFTEYWQPRTVTQFNGHDIMVVKSKGEFVWHSHADTDDFFLVLKGRRKIELRDQTIELGPGELFVVPQGVEHRPVAEEEVHLLLIEPTGIPNTSNRETAAARKFLCATRVVSVSRQTGWHVTRRSSGLSGRAAQRRCQPVAPLWVR